MQAFLTHSYFAAQGHGASIPGSWVMGAVRAHFRSGVYIVRCIGMPLPRSAGKHYKVEFIFEVLGGPYLDAYDARADVPRLADPAKPRNGSSAATASLFCNVQRTAKVWRIGVRSKLYQTLSLVLGDRERPKDADPAMLLAGRAFIATIASVERDWRKQPLSPQHRYSKIERLIEHVAELDECPDEGPVPF